MTPPGPSEITLLLRAWRDGDQTAFDRLASLVYDDLLRMARRFFLAIRARRFTERRRLPNVWDAAAILCVVAGLIGTFLGGYLGDRLAQKTPKAYLLVSGFGMFAAIPAVLVGLLASSKAVYLPALFLAEVFAFLNTGPANAVLVNVVVPEIRATAIAFAILVYHLVGDAPSPIIIGKVSDMTGSLTTALLLTSVAMAISGFFYLLGGQTLGRDTAKVAEAVAQREAS